MPNESCDVTRHVILNGGKAAVRDRTSAEGFDAVDGNQVLLLPPRYGLPSSPSPQPMNLPQ